MKDQIDALTVESRLEAALAYLLESGGHKISVAAVCALAKVNRANVYQSHQGFLRKIRAANEDRGKSNVTTKHESRVKGDTHCDLKSENRRLLLMCLEYRLKIVELEERMPDRV